MSDIADIDTGCRLQNQPHCLKKAHFSTTFLPPFLKDYYCNKTEKHPCFFSALSFPWQLLWQRVQDSELRQGGRKEETHKSCLSCPTGYLTCSGLSGLFLCSLLLHILSDSCRLLLLINLAAVSIFFSISVFILLLTLQAVLGMKHSYMANTLQLLLLPPCLLEMLKLSIE